MGSSSSVLRPRELAKFRKLRKSYKEVDIPACDESRSVTDKKGYVIFSAAILLLLPFLIYTLVKSDLRHITNGTDDCGNFCGYDNEPITGITCSGKNYVDKPFSKDNICVNSCPRGDTIWGRCIPEFMKNRYKRETSYSFDVDNAEDDWSNNSDNKRLNSLNLHNQGWKFLVTILITIALGIFTLVLLRFVPAAFVWTIIIVSMLILILGTVVLWLLYLNSNSDKYFPKLADILGALAIVWTIIALIVLIVLICLFKKIPLVIQLYKETTKALGAMPMLVFVPVLITFVQIIVFLTLVVTTVYMSSSRELVQIFDNVYYYNVNGIMLFAIIFNLFVGIWTMRLIAGIQYMIISGSVARWYFAKNKQYLDSPIWSSFRVTFRYHIGTAAFGSFLMTLFSLARMMIRSLCRVACCRCYVLRCCSTVEVILKFLSENSYIETAIHGQSYLRSAKRATKLLLANAASVIAINCVGDFVLSMIVLIVTIVATGISYTLFMNIADAGAATAICFVINLIVICIIFGTFQTVIDTLFICFCEDSVINDGVARPYFMSRGLMEFVESSKKVYGKQYGQ